jgi:hypothetical protein
MMSTVCMTMKIFARRLMLGSNLFVEFGRCARFPMAVGGF